MGLDIWKWFRSARQWLRNMLPVKSQARPEKKKRPVVRTVRESDLVWIMPLGQELEEQEEHF